MHPDLAKLIVLQTHDIEAKRLHEEINAAPKRVAEAELRAKDAMTKRVTLREEIAKEETLRRRLESDIADRRLKVERTQKKIDAATTTVQVTALEHEATFARNEISRLEDTELESMERSEALEARRPQTDEAVDETNLVVERERARANDTIARDKALLAEVDKRREAERREIAESETGESSLSRYDRIAKARGTAVTEVVLGKCTACGMMVRPQLWNDLRDNGPDSPASHDMMSCENCGRLLYYDPARDAPQRKPVQGESIAASIVRSSL